MTKGLAHVTLAAKYLISILHHRANRVFGNTSNEGSKRWSLLEERIVAPCCMLGAKESQWETMHYLAICYRCVAVHSKKHDAVQYAIAIHSTISNDIKTTHVQNRQNEAKQKKARETFVRPIHHWKHAQVGIATTSAKETDLTRHKRACILKLMAMSFALNGGKNEWHRMMFHTSLSFFPCFYWLGLTAVVLIIIVRWAEANGWLEKPFGHSDLDICSCLFSTHQLRYLPRDKGLAEEASARFERWLEAPDRQDVLPDDLKTSMFKSLGWGEWM